MKAVTKIESKGCKFSTVSNKSKGQENYCFAEKVSIYKSIHSIATAPAVRISAKFKNLPKSVTIVKSSNVLSKI